jgi:hypothetical protein
MNGADLYEIWCAVRSEFVGGETPAPWRELTYDERRIWTLVAFEIETAEIATAAIEGKR